MKTEPAQERQLYSPFSYFFGDTRYPNVNKLLNVLRAVFLGAAVIYCIAVFVWFIVLWITIGG